MLGGQRLLTGGSGDTKLGMRFLCKSAIACCRDILISGVWEEGVLHMAVALQEHSFPLAQDVSVHIHTHGLASVHYIGSNTVSATCYQASSGYVLTAAFCFVCIDRSVGTSVRPGSQHCS